jgi:hypothetical protein
LCTFLRQFRAIVNCSNLEISPGNKANTAKRFVTANWRSPQTLDVQRFCGINAALRYAMRDPATGTWPLGRIGVGHTTDLELLGL